MADLFTLPELASYLQRDLDTSSATLAREVATGLVEAVTGPLQEATVTVTLPVDRATNYVSLPVTVVTEVSEVVVGTVSLTADTEYVWERPTPRIRLVYVPSTTTWPVATVTATVGYPAGSVPSVAKAVALSAAARAYDNPMGLRSVAIDDYAETRAGSDTDLAGLTLTDAEMAALAPLRPTAYVTSSV